MDVIGQLRVCTQLEAELRYVPRTTEACVQCGTLYPQCNVVDCNNIAHTFLSPNHGTPDRPGTIYLCDFHSYVTCFGCCGVFEDQDEDMNEQGTLCKLCEAEHPTWDVEAGEYDCCA